MAQYDQLILLAVLGGVVAFVWLLARQIARQEAPAPRDAPPLAEPVSPPLAALVHPSPSAPTAPIPMNAPAIPSPRPRRKRKPASPTIAGGCAKTPIDAVLALLREKDSLATAFLVREILDAPISRRR